MNLEKALATRGWMSDHELHWLAAQALDVPVIIEVGCAYGRSTCALVSNDINGTVYAIDTWNGSPDELDTNHKDYRELQGDSAFLEFCNNLWKPIAMGQVVPLRMHSEHAAALFLSHQLKAQFIFIDGDHTYEAVKSDINWFLPILEQGGIIAGHDYGDSGWPGVSQAVDEIFPDVQIAPLTRIWYKQL